MRVVPFILLFPFVFFSCTYNSEEDLYGTTCDTTIVNYGLVQPVFEINCVICHNAGYYNKDIILDTYPDAVAAANTGRLIKAVNHTPGATPMPYGGNKLPQCEVRKVTLWIEQGTPE